MITCQQYPGLVPSITMLSTYRYIRILCCFAPFWNDSYSIILIFICKVAQVAPLQNRYIYWPFARISPCIPTFSYWVACIWLSQSSRSSFIRVSVVSFSSMAASLINNCSTYSLSFKASCSSFQASCFFAVSSWRFFDWRKYFFEYLTTKSISGLQPWRDYELIQSRLRNIDSFEFFRYEFFNSYLEISGQWFKLNDRFLIDL